MVDRHEDKVPRNQVMNGHFYLTIPDHKEYDPYRELAYAIIFQQIYDLDRGLKRLIKKGVKINDICNQSEYLVAEKFFKSLWFLELCSDSLDGDHVLKRALDNFERYGTVYNKEDQHEE